MIDTAKPTYAARRKKLSKSAKRQKAQDLETQNKQLLAEVTSLRSGASASNASLALTSAPLKPQNPADSLYWDQAMKDAEAEEGEQ